MKYLFLLPLSLMLLFCTRYPQEKDQHHESEEASRQISGPHAFSENQVTDPIPQEVLDTAEITGSYKDEQDYVRKNSREIQRNLFMNFNDDNKKALKNATYNAATEAGLPEDVSGVLSDAIVPIAQSTSANTKAFTLKIEQETEDKIRRIDINVERMSFLTEEAKNRYEPDPSTFPQNGPMTLTRMEAEGNLGSLEGTVHVRTGVEIAFSDTSEGIVIGRALAVGILVYKVTIHQVEDSVTRRSTTFISVNSLLPPVPVDQAHTAFTYKGSATVYSHPDYGYSIEQAITRPLKPKE